MTDDNANIKNAPSQKERFSEGSKSAAPPTSPGINPFINPVAPVSQNPSPSAPSPTTPPQSGGGSSKQNE